MTKKYSELRLLQFTKMLPYLLATLLFGGFFIADYFTAQSGYGSVPAGLPSKVFVTTGIIFVVVNNIVLLLSRRFAGRVIITSIAMALMVGCRLVLDSIEFS